VILKEYPARMLILKKFPNMTTAKKRTLSEQKKGLHVTEKKILYSIYTHLKKK